METKYIGNIAVSKLPTMAVAYSFKNTIEKSPDKTTVVKIDVKDKTANIASWGAKNDYPQKIIEAIKQSGAGSA